MKHDGPQPKLVARCRMCLAPITAKRTGERWVMLNEDGTEHTCEQMMETDHEKP
jgi:hypothetical protein